MMNYKVLWHRHCFILVKSVFYTTKTRNLKKPRKMRYVYIVYCGK